MNLPWLGSTGAVRWVIAALALLGVVYLVRRLLMRAPPSPHTEQRRCPACQWAGQVSRYRPVCPKCGKQMPAPSA